MFLSLIALNLVSISYADIDKGPASTYSMLDQELKSCILLEDVPEEAEYANYECTGFAGYRLFLEMGDARSWIAIQTPAGIKYEFQNIGSGMFPYVSGNVEWRYILKDTPSKIVFGTGQKPESQIRPMPKAFAAIVRLNSTDVNDDKKIYSELAVISFVAKEPCLTALVPAGPKQNETARIIADNDARAGKCLK